VLLVLQANLKQSFPLTPYTPFAESNRLPKQPLPPQPLPQCNNNPIFSEEMQLTEIVVHKPTVDAELGLRLKDDVGDYYGGGWCKCRMDPTYQHFQRNGFKKGHAYYVLSSSTILIVLTAARKQNILCTS